MTVGACLLMMILACAILVNAPKLFVPVTTMLSIALVTLPIYGATFFDNLAKKVMHFKFREELIFKFIPIASLHELFIIISSTTPTTPFTPPRRLA
jgi:hypothetical protein